MSSAIFDHLTALISIILSLGIANLVAFVATLVHRQKRVRLSAPQLLWAATIFMAQIEFWLSAFAFRTISQATVWSILFVMLVPILHYLQAVLVVPEERPGEVIDLKRHHEENYREYIGAGVATNVITLGYLAYMMALNPGLSVPGAYEIGGLFTVTGLIAMFVRWHWVQVLMPAIQLTLRLVFLPAIAATMGQG
ncbi:hypothetical protein sos41_05150 [Alphaproteobacteria bacterium SO-S41]|nr:hypothetical protein sos41_05150 [Alphaproteobacteria bacterium SO-S41]